MSAKMSGRGEGSSNAWSRGRPVMSNYGGGGSSRGPPPGLSQRGRGHGGDGRGRDHAGFGGGAGGGSGRPSSAPSGGSSPSAGDPSRDPALRNRERFLHLVLSMVGHGATVTTTDGTVLEGVFHGFSPFEKAREEVRNVYGIKGVRLIQRGADSSEEGELREGGTLLIASKKVARLQIKSLRLDNLPGSDRSEDAFRTDAEISGQRGGTERLVAAGSVWTAAGDGGGLGGIDGSDGGVSNVSIGGRGGMFKPANANNWRSDKPASAGLQGTIGDWDQFSANEKRFNVKASFDENLYTTALDYDNVDSDKMAEAERIAKEIESTASTNIHLMEERNQKICADYDEEDLYSGVLKKKEEEKQAESESAAVEEKRTMNYAAAAGAAKKAVAAEGGAAAAASANVSVAQDAQTETATSKLPVAESVDSSTEEKKGEPDEVKADAEEPQTEKEDKPKEEAKEPSKLKLNPNAKAFTFNPSAKSFTPSFAASAPPPAAPTPEPVHNPMEYPGGGAGMHPMMAGQYGMGGMQYVQHGGPGMVPMMNAQHPQMRQPYPPYGPGQPMQIPQQQPTPGQEDSSSVATGEGSAVPSDAQAPGQHPQQQYMQGYVPPGSYPGYYGAAAAAMMHHHPHQRPGFHPPPQMQVMPGGAYQRMYPGMMQPMRGPPGPYGYGPVPYPGGGYPNHNGEEGHKFQRKNSKGNGGGYKNKQRNNFQGRGGGNGGRGFQNNYSEGRQSEDGSLSNHEGEGSEPQSDEGEKVAASVVDAAA